MKNLLVVVMLIAGIGPASPSRALDRAGSPAADLRLGEDSLELRYQAAIVSANKLFVAVKKRSVGVATGPWVLSVWTIDPSGRLLDTVDLAEPIQPSDSGESDIVAMTSLGDGSLACAVLSNRGELKIARILGRNVAWSPGNKTIAANLHILRMLSTSDGNLMILGHRSGQPIYSKITLQGISIWERKVPGEKAGALFDGILTSRGGGFIVADLWQGDPFMVGESWIWIARIGASGEILQQTRMRGRRPRLASSTEGAVILIYDKGDSAGQQIVLQNLSETLKPQWDVSVLTNNRGMETFNVARLSDGGYAVAGGDDLKLFTSVVDSSGKVAWSFRNPKTMSAEYHLFALKEDFLVVYPVINIKAIDSRRILMTKLGVTRFHTAQ